MKATVAHLSLPHLSLRHLSLRHLSLLLIAFLLIAFLLPAACDGGVDLPGAGNKLTPVGRKKPLLSGHVMDEAGRPVAGVAVQVFSPIPVNDRQSLLTKTDEAGYFELDVEGELGIESRIPLLLDLRREWFLPAQHRLSEWRPGLPRSVDVTLSPAGAVAGRVVTEDDRPVPGALVFALPPDVPGVENRNAVPSTVTDETGRFRLPGLPIRGMDIGVLAEGHAQALKGPVNVLAKVEVAFGDITLSPGERIAGQVRTLTGNPVVGAVVRAFQQQELRNFDLFGRASVKRGGATVRTGEDGRFDMTTLGPGSYTVEAEAAGHRVGESSCRDVAPGRTDLVLTLEPILEIELMVYDESSKRPVSVYDVTIVTESMDMKPVSRDQVRSRDGIYKFVVSEGATYRLTVAAEGYESHETTITVTEDFDRSLRVALTKR